MQSTITDHTKLPISNSFNSSCKSIIVKHQPILSLGIVTLFGNFLAFVYRTYLVIFFEKDLLLSSIILSVLVSSMNFLQIPLRIPLGNLSQVTGRKPIIVMGISLYTISIFLLSYSKNWIGALFSVICFAIGMSSFWPATFSYIGDVNLASYGKSNGKIFQAGDIGVISASILASYLLDQLQLTLNNVFLIVGLIGSLFTVLAIFILPESLPKNHENLSTNYFSHFWDSFKNMVVIMIQLIKMKSLRNVYLLQIIISFSSFGFIVFFPALIVSYGYSKGTVAEISLISTLILIFFKPYLGSISDHLNLQNVVFLSLTIVSMAIASSTFVSNFFFLIGVQTIFFAGMLTAYTAVNRGATKLAPFEKRGAALGALGVFVSLGRSLSTLYVGFVYSFFSLSESLLIFSITLYVILLFTFLKIR